ncbi:thermostable hemolysin [Chromohalobacter israelensis]|uniref:Thermostable hemolysin n=1 Tax=Chromohalobacter israelensis (strain ATCC BAA-138 / DSM 3043 / CIP 106854 / NCIMB 13768 / 1H11) TaxID=290398 RepID=Q1QZU5_CHRI1|nr:thermostable hemolysin [Chromohalobacter salexigens]ABE58013.1 hypothetical protein Csal_0652 [Chromohalobacter salexigens DSM 3043]
MHEPRSPRFTTVARPPHVWREADIAERTTLEAFIADGYAREHGATLTHFQPRLFGLWRDEELLAALGLCNAGHASLFLERYLEAPIERRLAEVAGVPCIARHQVIEVGNLVTLRPGLLRPLIVMLIGTLIDEGMQWLTFTATTQVRNAFHRLGLEAWPLAEADPARLGQQRHAWGRYYTHAPQVMGGDLRRAWQLLGSGAPSQAIVTLPPARRTGMRSGGASASIAQARG